MAGLCRICGQCDRSAGYWRDRCRACRRAVRAGRACASADLRRYLRCWFTCRSVRVWPSRARRAHRSNARAAHWREMQMRQLDLLYRVLCGSVFVALHPEKLTSWLGRILCPTLINTDFRAVFRLPVSSGGRALRRADRSLRFAAGPDGHSEWLPDNGYAGGTSISARLSR